MIFNSQFYRDAEKLHREIEQLQIKYPTLWLGEDLVDHIVKLGIKIHDIDTGMRRLAESMVKASEALNGLSEAMDQNNLGDSSKQGKLVYSAYPPFLLHIGRIVRAMFYWVGDKE